MRSRSGPLLGAFLLPLAACGAPRSGDSPSAPDTESALTAAPRLLTGDATVIADDWTATEGGAKHAIVKDGSPDKPWISSAHFVGDRSLAFRVPTDLTGHKQRVEYKIAQASDADGLHFDDARYSGFAFKLDASPEPFLGSAIFWQAWQGFPWGPPVSLKVAADENAPFRIRLGVRNMDTGPGEAGARPPADCPAKEWPSSSDITLWSSEIEPNTWHTFLVYLEPRFDRPGRIKLWMDGAKVLDWSGRIGYDPSEVCGAYRGLDLKNGIYQPSANNGHTFYFDQIFVTSTYASAAPLLGW